MTAIEHALKCLEELANMPLGISLEDWSRLSGPILSALRSQSPEPSSSEPVAMKLMDALERMVALYEGEFDIVGGRPDWLVEALNLRFSTLSPTVSQPGTGEEVEWTEPPLTCPHIDAAIASGELSEEVAQELATIRDINSQLRYGTWALKARFSDYQALKAELDAVEAVIYRRHERGFLLKPLINCPSPSEAVKARLSAVEGALRNIDDMIDNCAGVPRNPDSLPMMVLQYTRQTLTTITGGENER